MSLSKKHHHGAGWIAHRVPGLGGGVSFEPVGALASREFVPLVGTNFLSTATV